MKRVIRAAKATESIMQSRTGMFELVREEGIGMNDTPWKGLEVRSYGPAEKHVVQIRLERANHPDFNGEPVEYQYRDAEVAHGMRMQKDTLEDTREYIEVLEEAVDFAEDINDLLSNGSLQ